MNEIILKDCPFCGGEAILHSYYGPNNYAQYTVNCTKCYISKSWQTDINLAIEQWNKRVTHE